MFDRSTEGLHVQEVYETLCTRASGLTEEEAGARLERFGANVISEGRKRPLIVRFLANFTHLMAILLWTGSVVAFFARMPQLGLAIILVNVINGSFSFWQEYKAEKATEALRRLLPTYSNVLRGGKICRIPAEELVPGDVMLLAEGDRISADGRLVKEVELRIDQSTLTGESRHVRKRSEPLARTDLARVESPNLIFSGTNVVSGNGEAVVLATGMESELGRIARFTQNVSDEPSPLQKEMIRVTKLVTLIAVSMGAVFFALAALLAGIDVAESFIFSLGMIVAFVPEGLLPTVTLALAMGVQRMARRHALIKRLSAVETLGCTSVICTDKTGTLTQNEMTVRDLWFAGTEFSVTGVGYTPEGEVGWGPQGTPTYSAEEESLRVGDQISQPDRPAQVSRPLLIAAALCSNARLLPPDLESARWRIVGDPTEAAIKVAAIKSGLDLDRLERFYPRLRELPFDSRRKRMSTIHGIGGSGHDAGTTRVVSTSHGLADEGSRLVFLKGAPKEVLALCKSIRMRDGEMPLVADWRTSIMDANDAYARRGLRVLAVAQRSLPEASPGGMGFDEYASDQIERDLTFLGLIAMMDPPRLEVSEAVAKCHRAGIRVVMITGDYGLTAESVARRIGIIREGQPRIISGMELDSMDHEALKEALSDEVIFARVAPEHKLRVVTALQEMGHVTAVTGDGVNDAPALKKADIGVAMGLSGTDVAKESADMILTDDNFASIVNAVEEGRAVYENIKKFTGYIFTSNTPEAVPFILFALSRARIPLALNVMHILAVDLGTDLMPALALGAEPPEPGLMNRPPRCLKEHVITRSLLLRAYPWLGLLQSTAVMGAFYFYYWTNGYWGQWLDLPSSGPIYHSATAMALACVVTTQIGNLFAQRTERHSVFGPGFFTNRLLWIGILSELVLISLIVYVPFLQSVVGTGAFAPQNWFFLFALSPTLLVADEARKALVRFRERKRNQGAGSV